jgi:hypothetical protein
MICKIVNLLLWCSFSIWLFRLFSWANCLRKRWRIGKIKTNFWDMQRVVAVVARIDMVRKLWGKRKRERERMRGDWENERWNEEKTEDFVCLFWKKETLSRNGKIFLENVLLKKDALMSLLFSFLLAVTGVPKCHLHLQLEVLLDNAPTLFCLVFLLWVNLGKEIPENFFCAVWSSFFLYNSRLLDLTK